MSPSSRLKLPVKKKQPDLNRPVSLGFDPTQPPIPDPPPLRGDTLRLYKPARKIGPLRRKVKYPEPTAPNFNKGRL